MVFSEVRHDYQTFGRQHIIDNPAAGLLLDMGLGKTATTLSAVDWLQKARIACKVLVIAPKRVADEVWTTEANKWDDLRHLRISKVLGTEKQRKEALARKADIWVINRENIPWLISHYQLAFPFDMVIIDESSSFKSPKSQRFKALKAIRPKIKRVVILTGTPIPNGLLDIWSQLYLLDQGERLGKTIGQYRDKYFNAGKGQGHIVYAYELKGQGKKADPLLGDDIYSKEIYDKIGDICISMKARDYLDLPERVDTIVEVTFSPKVQEMYDQFEKTQVLLLEDAEDISAVNAATLVGKLMQFTGGAVYNADKTYYEAHTEKLAALLEVIEEANGQPVLIGYWFKHEAERIMAYLKKNGHRPLMYENSTHTEMWNRGEIPIMLGHPASMGHGLNLQYGGHYIVWYANIWALELYMQFIARLDRQGQRYTVTNARIVVKGTIDEKAVKVKSSKEQAQEALMSAVKAIIAKHRQGVE